MARISLAEAARRLNLSPSTLRHQIRNGRFKAEKIGRDWTTTENEVDKYKSLHALPAEKAASYKGRTRKPK